MRSYPTISISSVNNSHFFDYDFGLVVVVVVIQPLLRDGDMAEDHGAQKPGNSPGPERS